MHGLRGVATFEVDHSSFEINCASLAELLAPPCVGLLALRDGGLQQNNVRF